MDGLATSIAHMESTAPYDTPLKSRAYEAALRKLQIELLKLQLRVREGGRRLVILFEGRDAAGKGGSIKRFTENLNPRGGRVVALTKPNETERGQWYFEEEQQRRFATRRQDPLRRWKLSPIDEASLGRFHDYTEARNAMFFYTDTPEAPWTVVNSNDKRRARLEAIRAVLHALDDDHKDTDVAHAPAPRVVRPASALEVPADAGALATGGRAAAT
jgi:polyphosphate kinase 2 (PPK2 family)